MRSLVIIIALAGCSAPAFVQCLDDSDCQRLPGGHCTAATNGHQWCSYADTACESGQRWSDRDVGDGLAGSCVGDEQPMVDAGIDAALDCVAGTTTCSTDTFIECSVEGKALRSMHCPLGCDVAAARCIDVDPSNGLAAQLDLTPEAPAIMFTGTSTINTSTGVVFNGGVSITVPTDLVDGMRVLRFKTLSVQGTLKVTGTRPLVLLSDGDVAITGLVDVSADGTTAGPGPVASGGCLGGRTQTAGGGGGGGGRFDGGGDGGTGEVVPGAAGGLMLRDPDIVPLVGGCGGGGWGTVTMPGVAGGGGGGAIQIVSRSLISITAGGTIDASGGGGGSGAPITYTTPIPGNGGGSGGTVLLEAPQIVLDGANVVISTKGGGGGGGTPGAGASAHGSDGGTTAAPAAGGDYGTGWSNGGTGGTTSMLPGPGAPDTNGPGAGGGGSVGEVRFNNTAGSINPQNGASIYSRRTSGSLATRLVP